MARTCLFTKILRRRCITNRAAENNGSRGIVYMIIPYNNIVIMYTCHTRLRYLYKILISTGGARI